MLKPLKVLFCFILFATVVSSRSLAQPSDALMHSIAGTIEVERPIEADVLVWAMRLQVLDNGQVVRPSKQAIFAASVAAKKVVAHGTTEYAIITRPNQLEFDVAVASMKPELWDAPYCKWTQFKFNELFSSTSSAPTKGLQKK